MDTRFDGTDDIMDPRDITERIEEIEAEYGIDPDDQVSAWPEDMDESDIEEYKALRGLAEDAEYFFQNQESFISEDYFTEYTEELCTDVGYIPQGLPSWIENHIDWEGVADEIKIDYTEFEFRGTTYYAR